MVPHYSGTTAAPTDGLIVEGNMGLGTNAPAEKLDIKVASSGYDRVHIRDTKKIAELGRNNVEGTGYLRLQNNGLNSVWIQANGLSYFNGGNVGIGTTTPQSKLDVEGSVAIGSTYSGTTAAPS